MNSARRFRLRASLAVAECPIHDSFIAMSGVRVRRTLAHLPFAAAVLILATVSAQQSAAQTPAQPVYTLHARVPLTIVDVTVTDAKGHPVHNLKQSDFTLLEDGNEMKLNSFGEHRTYQAQPALSTLVQQKLPPNTFTNATPTPPNAAPINILLIDNLNTPTQTQHIVQQQMLAFVKRMPPGTRMAVFGLSERLFIVQGITTDPELLKAAILSSKNVVLGPPNQDLGQDPADIAAHSSPMTNDPCDETDSTRTSTRAEITLSAMRQIARYLSGMSGRKNLIWFGGSFPSASPENIATGATLGECYDFRDALNSATDLLARAHVAIDPIESRGLRTDNNTNRKLLDEHYNMDLRAEQTGGNAVYTSNDLAGAVAADLDLGSNFYTLTYAPTNQTLDTRFRSISVKVDQPNLHLTYRNGYYAVDPTVDARGKKIDSVTPMQAAMMRGALDATQIPFRVKIAQSATNATPSPLNQPDPKQMRPPYRHYSVSFLIDIHPIDFAPSIDGNYRGDFEYGVRVYNADGDAIVNSASKTVSPILIPAVYKSMLNGGANAHLDIDVPATGDYFLRLAVHDLASNRVGSLEIPTAAISPEPLRDSPHAAPVP